MSNFEVTINGYDFALQQAHDEIEEATGSKLPNDTVLTMELIETDGDDLFYQVTLTGPHAEVIAQAIHELQEPCPPSPVDVLTCLMSDRFQDMTVRDAIAELKANGLL